jgi:hypothetical protein
MTPAQLTSTSRRGKIADQFADRVRVAHVERDGIAAFEVGTVARRIDVGSSDTRKPSTTAPSVAKRIGGGCADATRSADDKRYFPSKKIVAKCRPGHRSFRTHTDRSFEQCAYLGIARQRRDGAEPRRCNAAAAFGVPAQR